MSTKLLILIFIVCAFAFLMAGSNKEREVRENDESRCTRRSPQQPWICEPKAQQKAGEKIDGPDAL
jgi:hypothetical protein